MEGARAAISKFERFLFVTLGLKDKLSDLNVNDKTLKDFFVQVCKSFCSLFFTHWRRVSYRQSFKMK